MQATLATLSRLVSRSLVTGVVSSKEPHNISVAEQQAKLVTAVSGFPKQKSGYNIDNILKGQIGDDAYFVARHIDDWEEGDRQNNVSVVSQKDELCPPKEGEKTESSKRIMVSAYVGADVVGVADGVGGWRQYGVDPGQFSTHLMRNCERLVNSGYFSPTQPAKLLAQSFREMQESKTQIIGSSTACVLMLNHVDAKIYTANMGDSGFMVVRGEKVVHRSQEQQHFFNTPFQLSLPPSEMATQVLADHPDTADKYEFKVEDGDFIMLATDGVFDNLPDHLLISEITKVPKASARWPPSLSSMPSEERKEDDPACAELAVNLQQCANSIALMARQLSQDQFYLSPFSENACAAGFNMLGGKEDDITVLLAAVRLREGFNPS